jgi:multidrug transporter EmrE-like cation transporter
MTSMRLSWFAVPVLNTLFQVFLKRGAEQLDPNAGLSAWLPQALVSHWIMAAIVVEIACFAIWMTVLAELDLGKAFPLSGISYLLVIATGWFVFGEPVVGLQLIGGGLILFGVWLIAGANETEEGPSTVERSPEPIGFGRRP